VIHIAGHLLAVERSKALLGRLYVLQGRLRQAATTYEQVRQALPGSERLPTSFGGLFYHFGLGDLLREWNDLEAAERHLLQGMALIDESLTLEPFVALLGYTALARLQQARGTFRAALETLDAALLRVARLRHFPLHLVTQGSSLRAQLLLAQGDMAEALRWADASGLSIDDEDLGYPLEGRYLALARLHIAQGRDDPAAPYLQDALHLLERLQREAETKGRVGSVLEILELRALAYHVQGDRTAALATLERALLLAEPGGYVRLFVDEGAPMLALLRLALVRSRVPGYVTTLLRAFGELADLTAPRSAPRRSSLLEPLTGREREVLHLLAEGASNREIARRLVLSVGTVKKYVYNICSKLGVQSRTQALARARTLHLL
jgi:LuxR family maltose regulon positive regulatory protein